MGIAVCGRCGAKLRLDEQWAEVLGHCSRCQAVVRMPKLADAIGGDGSSRQPLAVEQPAGLAVDHSEPAAAVVQDAPRDGLSLKPPAHLGRYNHYLICNSKEVIAHWENDGRGWMVKVKHGFVRASTIPAQVPTMGAFVVIEIDIENNDGSQRLRAVNAFLLSGPWALSKLFKSDDMILEAIVGRHFMSDRQKAMARERINEKFLPQVWDGAEAVLG
ncbi:MAG: hypothetical protein WD030_00550 [Pirellulales bacterium]